MDEFNQTLDLEEFMSASCKLYDTLCVSDKSEILRYSKSRKTSKPDLMKELFHVILILRIA